MRIKLSKPAELADFQDEQKSTESQNINLMNKYFSSDVSDPSRDVLVLREPARSDGLKLHELIASCPPLDPNSVYCNLLQCSHFAATTVVAAGGDELLGAVSGYLVPGRPDCLFIWQVAVAERARGKSLAKRMIRHILERDACRQVRYLETTITADNHASWRMFLALAAELGALHRTSPMFERSRHFRGSHATETLLRIGPFDVENRNRRER